MNKKRTLGMALATAAALAFTSVAVTSCVAGQAKEIQCHGINSCKGRSECKTASSDCKGKNNCKGQGYLMKTPEECKKLGGSEKQA